jgi:hypothetical protein
MPYRGLVHYEMVNTFKENGFAICYYIKGNQKTYFKVERVGKYGKLILSKLRTEIISK